MEQIISQAPDNLTEEYIKTIYDKNNNDIVKTLAELWNLNDNVNVNYNDNTITNSVSKGDEIRETCDLYDNEMQKMLNKNRTKQ